MRIMIRLVVIAIVGLAAFSWLQAQDGASAAEQELFVSVNRVRRAQGLPPLKWNENLAAAARRHAAAMAQQGSAEHGFAGEPSLATRVTLAGGRFVWLSENVAQGPAVGTIQDDFLRSPKHRANMLDSDMDSIGVGIAERHGQLFAVEDFSKAK